MNIHELALNAATKICNCDGNCFAPFKCERKAWQVMNDTFKPVSKVGKARKCVLMSYPVKRIENKKFWWEDSGRELTKSELFALCHECSHSKMNKITGEIDRTNCYFSYCMDCPVHMIEENMSINCSDI